MSCPISDRARPCGPRARPRVGCGLVVSVPVVAVVAVVAVSVAALPVSAEPRSAGPEPVVHVPPVASPVAEAFRAPPHPYGPGNRGLKYATEPGEEVRASASGEVVFAGQVAGSQHVTVRHADGVRTSYSFLSEVRVMVGQRMAQGEVVGTSGHGFHFGARIGDHYFDPASLFGGVETTVELVPFEVPPGATPLPEVLAISQVSGGGGGWSLSLPSMPSLPSPGDALDWLVDRGQDAVHYAVELNPLTPVVEIGWAVAEHLIFPPTCTSADQPIPAATGDRVALTIGGLGSSDGSSSVDRLESETLGYAPEEVMRFSYAGGLVPGSEEALDHLGLADVPLTAYDSEDTQGDLRESAGRLADLLEAMVAGQTGTTIDVYAHSMGGVVLRLALLELEQREVPLEQLGMLATLGSPHQGANLATAAEVAGSSVVGREGLAALEGVIGTGLDPRSPAVAQLSQRSPLVAELERAGLPDDVELVSIAARGDVTVPAPRTAVDGARNVTVPETGWSAHSELVGSEATTRELGLALADLPARCVGAWDVLQDEAIGHGMAYAQDILGGTVVALP